MVVAYDTLFSHEYRNRLLEKSPLRRWIHKIRSNGVEIGVIWLLLIICGFRNSRKAVHRALRNGSQYAREGSRTALQQMGKAVRRTLAVDARGTATNSSDFNANSDGSQRNDLSPAKLSGREQLLGFLLKNMDTILVGFLGYKLPVTCTVHDADHLWLWNQNRFSEVGFQSAFVQIVLEISTFCMSWYCWCCNSCCALRQCYWCHWQRNHQQMEGTWFVEWHFDLLYSKALRADTRRLQALCGIGRICAGTRFVGLWTASQRNCVAQDDAGAMTSGDLEG